MDHYYLLLTIPQWVIFVSIVGMVYGWAENKRIFWQLGCLGLVALGLFSLYALASGMVTPDIYITDEEVAIEGISPDDLPKEMFMIPIYWGLFINGLLSLATFIQIKRKAIKWYKWMTIVTMFASLALFFMIFGALKS